MDHSNDDELFRQDLLNITKTTISSKVLNINRNHFANLAVDAILRLKGNTDLNLVQVIKKAGGSIGDS